MGLLKTFLFTQTHLSERITGFILYYGDVYFSLISPKKCRIIERQLMPDPVQMCIEIPPTLHSRDMNGGNQNVMP